MSGEFKIIEYRTAAGSKACELDAAVMELLGSGYEPFGSPYLCNKPVDGVGGEMAFYQAMVLTNKPKVNLHEFAARENPPKTANISVVTDDAPAADVTR